MAKVIVIGAGPAGVMASVTAAQEGNEVILIDKNDRIGKKLFITGKGRCNVTNAKDIGDFFDYIPTNPHFLYSALYSYTNQQVMELFEKNGVRLKVERGDRVFPQSDKSSDIIKVLDKLLYESGVEVMLNTQLAKFNKQDDKLISVETKTGKVIKGDSFVLCTGGVSYPGTGSTGEGLKFTEKLGHTIVKPQGALVPIETNEEWAKSLMGLSLKNVELTVKKGKKVLFKNRGEMLFPHFGISGP